MDSIELLKQLTETPGPSGFEQRIAATVRELWEPYADTVSVDRLEDLLLQRQDLGDDLHDRVAAGQLVGVVVDAAGLDQLR